MMATVPVLCGYTYRVNFPHSREIHYGSKMIHVAASHQIEREFEFQMSMEVRKWSEWMMGPRPISWKLDSYLPYNGLEEF